MPRVVFLFEFLKRYIPVIRTCISTHRSMADSGHFRCNLLAFTSSQLPPKCIILANNMLVSIGYHTGTLQNDNLTVVRIHYASYRDIGICLNIIGRWPSWNYLVKVAMKGFNRIIIIYSHLKQHI